MRVKQDLVLISSVSTPVSHVDEGEDAVEGGHEHVSQGEVEEEVVCNTPHSPVSCSHDWFSFF